MPSSAAKGPHGCGTIHTWIIGTGSNFTNGGLHPPSPSVRPATCPSGVKHRLSWLCHWVSAPPSGGVLSSVVPGAALYLAATSYFLPPRTLSPRDPGRIGSPPFPP